MDDDWTTVRWDKVDSLTGGTKDWPLGASLAPWYLAAFNKTAATFGVNPNANQAVNVTITATAGPALPGVWECATLRTVCRTQEVTDTCL